MNFRELSYYAYRAILYQLGNKNPLIASIKLTYRCNLKCMHCPWYKLSCNELHSVEQWTQVLKMLKSRGNRIVFLEGGETTLFPDLEKVIISAKALQFKVAVNTNGSNDLSPYEPDCFIISIDGNKETHNKIRGANSYETMIANTQTTLIKKIGIMTVNKLNYLEIEDVIQFNLDNKVFDALGFTIAYPTSQVIDNQLKLDLHEIDTAYELMEKFKDRIDIINSPKSLSSHEWICRPWFVDIVTPDGRISEQMECLVGTASEEKNCAICHAGCYKEAMQILSGNLEAWYMWNKYFFSNR